MELAAEQVRWMPTAEAAQALMWRSPLTRLRRADRIRPRARSAVDSVSASGLIVTRMPRRVHAARSMLSNPLPKLADHPQ